MPFFYYKTPKKNGPGVTSRFPAAAPTLAEFLNWMPSTEPPDDGAAEDIQESAEAALAATSQGI